MVRYQIEISVVLDKTLYPELVKQHWPAWIDVEDTIKRQDASKLGYNILTMSADISVC